MSARTSGTDEFRAARDFLLAHREDYDTAYKGFTWPRPEYFNWALDWFDVIAHGNDRTALHIVEEDGTETRLSFAEMSERSARAANWLRDRGVRADDRILVMLGNQAELWEADLGDAIEAEGAQVRQRQRHLFRDVAEGVAALIAVRRGVRQLATADAIEHDEDDAMRAQGSDVRNQECWAK